MNQLMEMRNEIDDIDSRIAELFKKRIELACRIADYKIANGVEVFDPVREYEKKIEVKDSVEDTFLSRAMVELFSDIMSLSRKKQYRSLTKASRGLKIDFKCAGNFDFTDAAVVYPGSAEEIFFSGGRIKIAYYVETWREALIALENGRADFAVLMVDDSTSDALMDNYDLISEFDFSITGEERDSFIIVSKEHIFREDADQVLISFLIPDKCGMLCQSLSHLVFEGLDLTRIKSYPVKDDQGKFRFFVSFSGNLNDEAVVNALTGLSEETEELKILGNC